MILRKYTLKCINIKINYKIKLKKVCESRNSKSHAKRLVLSTLPLWSHVFLS